MTTYPTSSHTFDNQREVLGLKENINIHNSMAKNIKIADVKREQM